MSNSSLLRVQVSHPPSSDLKKKINKHHHHQQQKNSSVTVHLGLGSQKESVPLLLSSVQDPVQWLPAHPAASDPIRYSPELSRFSRELETAI